MMTETTTTTPTTTETVGTGWYALALRDYYANTPQPFYIGTRDQCREYATAQGYYTPVEYPACPTPADMVAITTGRYTPLLYPLVHPVYSVRSVTGDAINTPHPYYSDRYPAACAAHVWLRATGTNRARGSMTIARHDTPASDPVTVAAVTHQPEYIALTATGQVMESSDDYYGIRDRAQGYADTTRETVRVVRYRLGDCEHPAYTALTGLPQIAQDDRAAEYVPTPLPVAQIPGYSVVTRHTINGRVADKSPLVTYATETDAMTDATRRVSEVTPDMLTGDDYGRTNLDHYTYMVVENYAYPAVPTVTRPVAQVSPSPAVNTTTRYPVAGDTLYEVLSAMRWDNRVASALWDVVRDPNTTTLPLGTSIEIDPTTGQVSYYPLTRTVVHDGDPYTRSLFSARGRVSGKLVKTLRKCFPTVSDRFNDAEWEVFGNAVKAITTVPDTFRVVRGDDIPYYYASDMKSPLAQGWSSCMTKDAYDTAHILAMYASNPEVCGLLIHTDPNGYLLGRALVWTATDGRTIVDRMYGSDILRVAFTTYAESQGWVCGWQSESWEVQLTDYDHDAYPYMDSLPYLDMTTGILSGGNPRSRQYRVLHSTTGDYDEYSTPIRVTLTRVVEQTALITIDPGNLPAGFTTADIQNYVNAMYRRTPWTVDDYVVGNTPLDSGLPAGGWVVIDSEVSDDDPEY